MIMLVWTVGKKMNLVIQLVNVTHYQIYIMVKSSDFFPFKQIDYWRTERAYKKKKNTIKQWIRNMEIVV